MEVVVAPSPWLQDRVLAPSLVVLRVPPWILRPIFHRHNLPCHFALRGAEFGVSWGWDAPG